jgi:NADH-quinone oxidoreductase subunit K
MLARAQPPNLPINYPITRLLDYPITRLPDTADMITPTHYMLLSAALFMIGVIGVMVRRNIIIIFMSIELILNAVNINLIAFSAQLHDAIGQVFAIFVIAVAAAEAAVGLGIILAFYRNKETVNIDEMNLMRW